MEGKNQRKQQSTNKRARRAFSIHTSTFLLIIIIDNNYFTHNHYIIIVTLKVKVKQVNEIHEANHNKNTMPCPRKTNNQILTRNKQ